jgi:Spondin_N
MRPTGAHLESLPRQIVDVARGGIEHCNGLALQTPTAPQVVGDLAKDSASECRFVGLHDYPLCQNGQWVDGMSASMYLLDAGVLEGDSWLAQPALNMSTASVDLKSSPQQKIKLVGHGTEAWNPYMCVPLPC